MCDLTVRADAPQAARSFAGDWRWRGSSGVCAQVPRPATDRIRRADYQCASAKFWGRGSVLRPPGPSRV